MEELDRRRAFLQVRPMAFYRWLGLTPRLLEMVRRGQRQLGAEALGRILLADPFMERWVIAYLRERGEIAKAGDSE